MGKNKIKKANKFGGSAGGGGYNYQSSAIAYVGAHILARHELGWISHTDRDLPVMVATETGGPGDDLDILLEDGTHIGVQAKHGLNKTKLWASLLNLAHGVANDPNLHAVLLVDSTTSSTIRTHLRKDIIRLAEGQTDDLKPITTEFLNNLKSAGIEITALAPRLRIIELNLDHSSSGEATGRQCLSTVLDEQTLSQAAWALLVKDGLDLISRRGRCDAASLYRLLTGSGIPLSKTACNLEVLSESFRSWILHSTETFTVAGLGVALPITTAWMQLRTFDEEGQGSPRESNRLEQIIARYHEWERLADRSRHGTVREAEYIAAFNRRVVVVGGPGAGKSTLLKRLAYRHSAKHKTVLRVRLPLVIRRMVKTGDKFDDALIKVAGDGSGIDFDNLRMLLASPDYLLADGLDECDPHRSVIADALAKWAYGHEHSTIIVTTRPVGHDPAMLSDWKHFELLPLDKWDTEKHARQILEACFKGETAKIEDELTLFDDHLRASAVASLAARNPLLLGFLIQLSINRIETGRRRAALYEQIVNLIHRIPPQDRTISVDLESTVALRSLEIFGWLLQDNPASSSAELLKQAGDILARELGVEVLEARRQGEQALKFWEERRLLERLSAGGQDAFTFIHLALCEYAAGRYAATLNDVQLEEWLSRVRRQPKWRETILLAAGSGAADRIVRILVTLDDVEDPTSVEAMLAAAAQSETDGIQPTLVKSVADRLLARLTSNVPLIVHESGHALLGLAQLAPEIIGSTAQSLLNHKNPWTRFVAWTLTLYAGREYVDLDLLEQSYETLVELGLQQG